MKLHFIQWTIQTRHNSEPKFRGLILIMSQLQETLAKKLVRVGLNKNVFTRKMEIQPRREYNFNFNFSDGN